MNIKIPKKLYLELLKIKKENNINMQDLISIAINKHLKSLKDATN
jgi:hypothetical protein